MIRYAALAVVLLLSGCAALLPSAQMSADQLNAIAKDSNANAVGVAYTGAGGQGAFCAVNTDKGALGTNGGSAGCKPTGEISIIVNPRADPAPRPTCATLAYERNADGACHEIRRTATTCGINAATRVDASKCPMP